MLIGDSQREETSSLPRNPVNDNQKVMNNKPNSTVFKETPEIDYTRSFLDLRSKDTSPFISHFPGFNDIVQKQTNVFKTTQKYDFGIN